MIELVEELDAETVVRERRDDARERVRPREMTSGLHLRGRVRIVAFDRELVRLPVREIGVLELQVRHGRRVVEGPHHRMELRDVEGPARFQEMVDDTSPRVDVRQPSQDAVRRVDDVEAVLEMVREVVELAQNESGIDTEIRGKG